MAHFAELDENNIVIQTIVVGNDTINDLPFPESEPVGVTFCKSLFGESTRWVQTSVNDSFRRRYGVVGYSYVPVLDIFINPQPFPSWKLDTTKGDWIPPIPKPEDTPWYYWDEQNQIWVRHDLPEDYKFPNYEVT